MPRQAVSGQTGTSYASFTRKVLILASNKHSANQDLVDFAMRHKAASLKLVFVDLETAEVAPELVDEVFDHVFLLPDAAIVQAASKQGNECHVNDRTLVVEENDNGCKLVEATVAKIDMVTSGGDLVVIQVLPGISKSNELHDTIESIGFQFLKGRSVAMAESLVESLFVKNYVEANSDSAEYWSKDTSYRGEHAERLLIEEVCVNTCVEEKKAREFSTVTQQKAVESLKKHGVVIFPGLFEERLVLDYGQAALRDMEKAVSRLKKAKGGIDLFRPGKGPKIENYQELGMREALRCDLRNGTAMKAQAEVSDHIRHHAGIKSMLLEVMHSPPSYATPFPTPEASEKHSEREAQERAERASHGNWGRWNFEGPGPEGPPPPLRVGQVGCVMSLPGCEDQTIHADTPHIYTHTQLPGHYYNLFLVGVERGSPAAGKQCGQTAFVLGSHDLETCASVMAGAGGQPELVRRLIRPHLAAGDALVFDCRILHLGLANRSRPLIASPLGGGAEPAGEGQSGEEEVLFRPDCSLHLRTRNSGDEGGGSSSLSLARPLLYINYTREFFEDPKNWNHKDSLFSED